MSHDAKNKNLKKISEIPSQRKVKSCKGCYTLALSLFFQLLR